VSGGQYASVFFVATAPPDSTGAAPQVDYSARIGTFFFMTVGGNLHPAGRIIDFGAPFVTQKSPVHFKLTIHNDGNIHIKPHSVLRISSFFGKTVYQAVDPGLYVLPGLNRKWELSGGKNLRPGYYTATLKTKITIKSPEIIHSIHFWIIPWQLALLLTVLVVGAWLILRPQIHALRKSLRQAGGMPYIRLRLRALYSTSIKKSHRYYRGITRHWRRPK
ncbi:MAG: hypothetical protein ABIS59_01605, partial [Candidatus Saccharibacteria bacterium]